MSRARVSTRAKHRSVRAAVVKRRLVSIPAVVVAWVAITAALPVLVVAAGVVDALRWAITRKPWMSARLVSFGWVYLSAEVAGLALMALAWVVTGFGLLSRPLTTATYAVQRWWAAVLFTSVRAIFRLRLRVEGESEASRPAVFMPRHASLIDTLLPAVLITLPHRIRLRYVLKRELLVDPALDVAGNRLPNHFVARGPGGVGELERLAALARDLGRREGLLIYPEGTRYRAGRQEAMVRRLAGKSGLHERAAQLEHLHPPRPGGALALLESGLDAVFIAHSGLDGFASVRDVWSGGLVDGTVHVSFRRVPAESIPADPKERVEWLFDEWLWVDREVGRLRS